MADPGGVDAAEPDEPLIPGLVMLDPLPDDPAVLPDDRLRRDRLVPVVLPVPPDGIGPIELSLLPIDPVGELPVMPGAVDELPLPVAPVIAPLPLDIWAPAAVAINVAAVIMMIVFITLTPTGVPLNAAGGWSLRWLGKCRWWPGCRAGR